VDEDVDVILQESGEVLGIVIADLHSHTHVEMCKISEGVSVALMEG